MFEHAHIIHALPGKCGKEYPRTLFTRIKSIQRFLTMCSYFSKVKLYSLQEYEFCRLLYCILRGEKWLSHSKTDYNFAVLNNTKTYILGYFLTKLYNFTKFMMLSPCSCANDFLSKRGFRELETIYITFYNIQIIETK